MLKKLFFLLAYTFSIYGFSQFTLAIDGNNVADGTILNYTGLGVPAGDFEFIVTNTATMPINVTMTLESVTNNSAGSNLQFCWNLCYTTILVNSSYPANSETLAVGASTAPHGNHFENSHLGDDTTAIVEYVLRYHEVDASGNEIGTPIRITYRYNPNAAISDFDLVEYELFPNVVDSNFTLNVKENVSGTIVNSSGQVIKEFIAKSGENNIDVSELSSQLYYIILKNNKNQKSLTKLLIK